jgi:DNA (cytosine-5)-methyltransferase 1
MSHGLKKSGLNVIAGIDIWQTAIDSYSENFDHLAVCADLTKLSPEEFKNTYNIPSVDIITGSPPCTTFSMAGKRDNTDSRNDLFQEYVKYINYFKPKAIIMENVMGMLSMKNVDGEKYIDIIINELSIYYNCIVCKLYASDFGVAQNRRRIIIIGIRKDLNIIPTEPAPQTERIAVETILEPREAVEAKYYLSPKAIAGIIRKREKSKVEGKGFGAQYLKLDQPCYTIPARYWKDGYDALVKYSETEIRRLTILELKRVQSFPDDYILCGNRQDTIIQIGNAVACEFGYHIGLHVQKLFQLR